MPAEHRRSPEPARPVIAVVGATGFTGGLVLEELREAGVEVRAIGRSPERLARLEAHYPGLRTSAAITWERDELRGLMEGCAAVISCAGPFVRAGVPVAEAAVAAKLSYCDSTGEQEFIRWVYDDLDARARDAGIALVPAFGFDYVPGDLGLALAAEGLGPLESAEVVYNPGTSSASRGTRRSIVGVLASGELGRRTRVVGGRTVASFPGGEELMAPRHLRVAHVASYMALPVPPAAVQALQQVLRVRPARAALARLSALGPAAVPADARRRWWWCQVDVQAVSGERRSLRLLGTDVYGFTAKALTKLALRMAAGQVDATGACSPAEVVEPRPFLNELGAGVTAAN